MAAFHVRHLRWRAWVWFFVGFLLSAGFSAHTTQAAPLGCTTKPVSPAQHRVVGMQMDGRYIVWQRQIGSVDTGNLRHVLFLYDIMTRTRRRVSPEQVDVASFKLRGDVLLWSGQGQLYLYMVKTGRTRNLGVISGDADTDGGQVVWWRCDPSTGCDESPATLMHYDIATRATTPVLTRAGPGGALRVAGAFVAWMEVADTLLWSEIWLYNRSNDTLRRVNEPRDFYHDRLVWLDTATLIYTWDTEENSYIMLHDLSSAQQTNVDMDAMPTYAFNDFEATDGQRIVFSALLDSTWWHLFWYDMATQQYRVIADDDSNNRHASTDGVRVAWLSYDRDPERYDVKLQRLSGGPAHTVVIDSQSAPIVSGPHVIWFRSTERGRQVMLTTCPTLPTGALVNVSFEAHTGRLPDGWQADGLIPQDRVRCGEGIAVDGECAFRFRGVPGRSTGMLSQNIVPEATLWGQMLVFEATFRGINVPPGAGRAIATVHFRNAPPQRMVLDVPSGTYDYQAVQTRLRALGEVVAVRVLMRFNGARGTLFIDQVTLGVESGLAEGEPGLRR